MNQIYLGDCLEWMPLFPDQSFDMILCDLPYGTTACKWDTIIPFEPLWEQYKRIIKPRGAIVLTASQPFTSKLVMSNLKMFRYEWVWEKTMATGFLDARRRPMKAHENVLVFSLESSKYNPQKTEGKPYTAKMGRRGLSQTADKKIQQGGHVTVSDGKRFPRSVVSVANNEKGLHPTQKPVALFEYLIRTYTQPGELVLDTCAGSGTTGVACINTGRRFVLIEREEKYHDICVKRCAEAEEKMRLTGAWCPR